MITREELCQALVDRGVNIKLIDEVHSGVVTRGMNVTFNEVELVEDLKVHFGDRYQEEMKDLILTEMVNDMLTEIHHTESKGLELYSLKHYITVDEVEFKPLSNFKIRISYIK